MFEPCPTVVHFVETFAGMVALHVHSAAVACSTYSQEYDIVLLSWFADSHAKNCGKKTEKNMGQKKTSWSFNKKTTQKVLLVTASLDPCNPIKGASAIVHQVQAHVTLFISWTSRGCWS